MVLKRLCICVTGADCSTHSLFESVRQCFEPFSQDAEFQVDLIVLVAR